MTAENSRFVWLLLYALIGGVPCLIFTEFLLSVSFCRFFARPVTCEIEPLKGAFLSTNLYLSPSLPPSLPAWFRHGPFFDPAVNRILRLNVKKKKRNGEIDRRSRFTLLRREAENGSSRKGRIRARSFVCKVGKAEIFSHRIRSTPRKMFNVYVYPQENPFLWRCETKGNALPDKIGKVSSRCAFIARPFYPDERGREDKGGGGFIFTRIRGEMRAAMRHS